MKDLDPTLFDFVGKSGLNDLLGFKAVDMLLPVDNYIVGPPINKVEDTRAGIPEEKTGIITSVYPYFSTYSAPRHFME